VTVTTIIEDVCSCGFRSVDGSEHCFLRKAQFKSCVLGHFELCFSWCFLYQCRDQLEEGRLWFEMLRGLIKAYQKIGWDVAQLGALQSLYKPLQEAIFDFVDLMCIDYVQAMRCKCQEPGQHLVADGVRVSCKSDQQCLFGNWLPTQPVGDPVPEPALLGSYRASRFVVQDWIARETLRKLSAPPTSRGGALPAEMTALTEWCRCHNAPLGALLKTTGSGGIVLLLNGYFYVEEWARGFFHEIGAHSPAVAVANIGSLPVLLKIATVVNSRFVNDVNCMNMPDWGRSDNAAAEVWFKPMYPFLRKLLDIAGQPGSQGLCKAACKLLEDLAQVPSPV
jgi:hypothetical protein